MKHRILSSHFLPFITCIAAAATMWCSLGYAQVTYCYKDENGVLVLTNIAPTRPVSDLRTYGAPVPPPPSGKAAPSSKVKAANTRKPPAQNPPPQIIARASNVPSDRDRVSIPPPEGDSTVGTMPRAIDFGDIIDKYAEQFRLDPRLVQSVIAQESGFKKNAVSPKGAQGLMQLMPGTAARLGVRDPFDPEQNIRGGTKHLRFLLDTFNNDLELSLAAYNAGENLVQRLGRVPDIRETREYVRSITSRFDGKEMRTYASKPTAPSYPSYFRYWDANGVLHITNIPTAGAVPAQAASQAAPY